MRRRVECLDQLLDLLRERVILIYGAGNIAGRFYEALSIRDLAQNVGGFVVTNSQGKSEFCGQPVISPDEIRQGPETFVCIAVHESVRDGIVRELERRGILDYVWVTPFLTSLFAGDPMQRNVDREVDDLIRANDDYRAAIRYLVIQSYYHAGGPGADLYLRAQGLSCGPATAKLRLEQFYRLIQAWETGGYDPEHIISVDENNIVLDGMHRLSLAKYHGLERVRCDVYRHSPRIRDWMGEATKMEKTVVQAGGFTREELELIERTDQKLRGEAYG